MMDSHGPGWSLAAAARALRDGDTTSQQLTRAALARVRSVDAHVRAFVTVTEEEALAAAAAADARIANETAGPLTGVPLALKDVITTAGVRTTCGSKMLEHYEPVDDAFVTRKLKEAGRGRGRQDQYGRIRHGILHRALGFLPHAQPLEPRLCPGRLLRRLGRRGRCGDGAGLPRLRHWRIHPAAGGFLWRRWNEANLRPRKPLWLDCVRQLPRPDRPLRAHSVEDAATLLQAIAGHDPCDSTSAAYPAPDFASELDRGVKGLRIAAPREFFRDADRMEPEVAEAVEAAIAVLEEQGAIVDRDTSLPLAKAALPVYYIIAPSEASANLARYDGVKYGYAYRGDDSMWDDMEKDSPARLR